MLVAQATSLTNNRDHNADMYKLDETIKSLLREEHQNIQNLSQKINMLDTTNKENQMFKVELECLHKKIDNKNSTSPIYNPITADTETITILSIKRNLTKIIYPKGLFQNSEELAEYLKSKNIKTDHSKRKSNQTSRNKPIPSPSTFNQRLFFASNIRSLGTQNATPKQTQVKGNLGRVLYF